MIPHIFHQVWFDLGNGSNPPQKYNAFRQTWSHHHPDAMFMLWNESMALDLLRQYYPWFLSTYNGYKNTIYRIDSIRYFILHHYGGVYIDLDLRCRKCVYGLLEQCGSAQLIVCGCSKIKWMINNFFMAAMPNSDFFNVVFQKLVKRGKSYIMNVKQGVISTLYIAGPWLLHQCVSRRKEVCFVLPAITFAPNVEGDELNYGVHEYHNSWNVTRKYIWDEARFIVLPVLLLICMLTYMQRKGISLRNLY